MLMNDKMQFAAMMTNCFQNYSRQIPKGFIDDWFDELKAFNSFHVTQAFKTHLRENEKFPPTLAAVIKLCKKSAAEQYAKIRNERIGKCYVVGCKEETTQKFSENIMMCRKHSGDYYLKTQPNSIEAEIVRSSKKFENEAKEKGMTNHEYFKFLNPPGKSFFSDVMTKNMNLRKSLSEIGGKKIDMDEIIASHNENMTPIERNLDNFNEIDFNAYDELFIER
jgi:hypothetical protein